MIFDIIIKNQLDVLIEILEKEHVDLNQKNEFGNTPLMLAADMFDGNETIEKLLLKNGANPCSKNNYGVYVYKILEMSRNKSIKNLLPSE